MVGKVEYTGVPTSMDLENNGNHKKYKVNSVGDKGFLISRILCLLLIIGAVLLAILVGLLVYFLVPRDCADQNVSPEALMKSEIEEVDERLPRHVVPTHYRLQIKPYLGNSSTTGTVEITLDVVEETSTIILHALDLDIISDSVRVSSRNGSIDVEDQSYLEGQRYQITVKEGLKQGEQYRLGMGFYGKLNGHLQGFYEFKYTDRYDEQNPINAASTQFSPTNARRAFPCFDEPSFKAKFTISIARPENMTTLSNMPLQKKDLIVASDGIWDHYPETPKMPTYLVAFIVSKLAKTQEDSAPIKVWSREILLSHTQYASDLAPNILKYFEDYFDSKFPLSKIDIVAVPEFGFSAMENWGLIMFRESSLLFDERTSTVDDQLKIATILSHEIAHQWFGNLVTPKWWNDLWLKEGFATYLEYLALNSIEPSWKFSEGFLTSEIERAMAVDALPSARPISSEVISSTQIKQAFDEISYAKGACLIRMMNHFLGEEAFRSGLTRFLKKYEYGNADRNDLFETLTDEAHRLGVLSRNETVKEIMDTWTEKPGFPVITAVPDYKQRTLKLIQKRFLFTHVPEESSNWWVPVSFSTDLQKDQPVDTTATFWLRGEPEITVSAEFNHWYLLNLNYTGYFIVNYDEQNWKALSDRIMDVNDVTRAQLISDAMDLARANLLDYDIPLKMIAKMAVRDNHIMFPPTEIAFKKLKFLSDMLSSKPAFGLFEGYHTTIFRNTYDMVDFNDQNDDYITKRIRRLVLEWSCRKSGTIITNKAIELFRQTMDDPRKSVSPNLRAVVYCTAVREGGEREWDYVFERYQRTTSPSERNDLLDALGCTKLKWLLSGYIDKLIDERSSIRIQDADRVFESVARNQAGLAFDFLRKNWNELLEHFGDGFSILGKMIKSLAPHMNTEFQLADLERFRDSIKSNISTTTIAFESAIQTVKSNVNWMQKNYQQVEDWFEKYKHHYQTF